MNCFIVIIRSLAVFNKWSRKMGLFTIPFIRSIKRHGDNIEFTLNIPYVGRHVVVVSGDHVEAITLEKALSMTTLENSMDFVKKDKEGEK